MTFSGTFILLLFKSDRSAFCMCNFVLEFSGVRIVEVEKLIFEVSRCCRVSTPGSANLCGDEDEVTADFVVVVIS
jgi:hypothetical protein